ncbi:transmembrane protein 26-like [Branchiostoma floridae x Branchiostoma belcheri]
MAAFVIFKALVTRLLFGAFGVVCIWRVYQVRGAATFWLLMLAEAGLFIETLFTLIVRKGKEWRWFSPCVLFYLCCTVPSIWLLELDQFEHRLAEREGMREACRNFTANVTDTDDDSSGEMDDVLDLGSFGISAKITIDNWVGGLEQILVMLLVIGRWLLPRGDLTRDELSQLLLVYIAMAADIVELFQVFEEDRVGNKKDIVYTALFLFTWSLLQFTIVLTAVRGRTSRPGAIHNIDGTPRSGPAADTGQEQQPPGAGDDSRAGKRRGTLHQLVSEVQERNLHVCGCCHPDVFAMVITIVMQDGPFLAFRLYLIFRERVLTQGILFFVGKNTLLIVLQLYRIVIICSGQEEEEKNKPVTGMDLQPEEIIMKGEMTQEDTAAPELTDVQVQPL